MSVKTQLHHHFNAGMELRWGRAINQSILYYHIFRLLVLFHYFENISTNIFVLTCLSSRLITDWRCIPNGRISWSNDMFTFKVCYCSKLPNISSESCTNLHTHPQYSRRSLSHTLTNMGYATSIYSFWVWFDFSWVFFSKCASHWLLVRLNIYLHQCGSFHIWVACLHPMVFYLFE